MTDINERVPARVSNEALVAERRARLIEAATELFLKKGYHKTTVREIAAAVGWHIGKLYLYISSKEDVLFLINEHIMRVSQQGLRTLPSLGSVRALLEAAARSIFQTTHVMRREIRLLYRETSSLKREHIQVIQAMELENRELLAGIIQKGIDAGEFRPVDAVLLAHDVLMLGTMWALKGWALLDAMTHEEYIEAQLDLIFSRLLPDTPAVENDR